jgi:hypothetical protein
VKLLQRRKENWPETRKNYGKIVMVGIYALEKTIKKTNNLEKKYAPALDNYGQSLHAAYLHQ